MKTIMHRRFSLVALAFVAGVAAFGSGCVVESGSGGATGSTSQDMDRATGVVVPAPAPSAVASVNGQTVGFGAEVMAPGTASGDNSEPAGPGPHPWTPPDPAQPGTDDPNAGPKK